MKLLNKYIFIIIAISCIANSGYAQVDTSISQHVKLSLTDYLIKVGKGNLGYAAQQYNVSISEAGIESAKVFPDPQLSVGGYNNQQATLHLGQGYNVGLGTTLELGGKRNARIGLAKSQAELSKALLLDYFRNLRADAAIAYYNTIQLRELLNVQQSSYQTIRQLADADSLRFKLGVITETDARQSKLEASNFLNTVFQNEADLKTSLVQLGQFVGNRSIDTLIMPMGGFGNFERQFVLNDLITNAQSTRADAVAAQNNKAVADKNLRLVKANRVPDLGVNAGYLYSGEATNDVAPTPAYRSISAGLSIPLKFSNHYKGDIKAATFFIEQAEVQYQQVLQQIQVEVTQAYFNYQAAQKQVQQFNNGMLTDAKKVLEGKIYSYKRGETSLLEVLNAQRTYNDVQQNYYQALLYYVSSLINLERASGIWDIN